MKNSFSLVIVLAIVLTAGLGCGFITGFQQPSAGSDGPDPSNGNRTLADRVVDTAVGQKKIGVPECDEVLDAIEAELNNPADDFVTKAVKATILNRIKDGIRQSAEQNQSNKADLARTCREFRAQFNNYKSQEAAGKKQ